MLRLKMYLAIALTVVLVACGGGRSDTNLGTNPGSDEQEKTDLYIALTDAEGDFLSYEVNVEQISLVKANGLEVEVLPAATTIDFAQYVEVSELLTRISAPPGRYNSATIRLDYSAANIVLQNELGDALVAQALDTGGQPLGVIDVDLQFGDSEGFALLPGAIAQLTLDFDLDASNSIVIENNVATVTVTPVFIADPLLEDPKPFRLRGLLNTVNEDDQYFRMDLRPFQLRTGPFGNAPVYVESDTAYEIDGEYVESEFGLAALSELEAATPIVTLGAWDRIAKRFIASEIRAGSSVAWGESDALRAVVVGREGNLLHVRGARAEFQDGVFTYNDELDVLLSDLTRIVQFRNPDADIASISVGSAIYVIGEFQEDNTMDASEGIVRIVPGSVSGTVVSASPLAIDINLLNARNPLVYDFSGTGLDDANNADPDYYEIATGNLSLENLELGDPIRIKGWISPFGSAPEDFEGFSVRNAANLPGHFLLNYGLQGSGGAVVSLDENGVLFDLESADTRHHIVRAGIATDIKLLPGGVPLVAPISERGVYAISVNNRIIVATWYGRFAELLSSELEKGLSVQRFDAYGYFDSDQNRFTSRRLRIRLVDTAVKDEE